MSERVRREEYEAAKTETEPKKETQKLLNDAIR